MNVHNEGKAREDRKISVRIGRRLAKVSRALGPGKVGWIQETKVQNQGTICYLAMTVAFQDILLISSFCQCLNNTASLWYSNGDLKLGTPLYLLALNILLGSLISWISLSHFKHGDFSIGFTL